MRSSGYKLTVIFYQPFTYTVQVYLVATHVPPTFRLVPPVACVNITNHPGELHFPGLFAKTALGLFFLVENLDLHVDKQKQHRKQDYKVNPLLDHTNETKKKNFIELQNHLEGLLHLHQQKMAARSSSVADNAPVISSQWILSWIVEGYLSFDKVSLLQKVST